MNPEAGTSALCPPSNHPSASEDSSGDKAGASARATLDASKVTLVGFNETLISHLFLQLNVRQKGSVCFQASPLPQLTGGEDTQPGKGNAQMFPCRGHQDLSRSQLESRGSVWRVL